MVARGSSPPSPAGPSRARCRCGHFPTHHMVVVSIGTTGNFRLEPTGPCEVCGDALCHRFTPGAP